MPRRSRLAIVLVVALGACGTSPSVRYYALDEPDVSVTPKPGAVVVEIGPFTVPEFLERPQIVIRDAGNALRFAEFDRWAESPPLAVVRWLARDVDRQLATASVVPFPAPGRGGVGYRVRGTIGRWDVDATGAAALVVQWDCVTDDGAVVLPLRTERYVDQADDPEDYGQVVRALNRTLAAFGSDIAAGLATVM